MSVHNYIQYRCNPNNKYSPMQGKKSRVSYDAIYTKIDVKTRKARWQPIFKENVGYTLNDSQYWLGCA